MAGQDPTKDVYDSGSNTSDELMEKVDWPNPSLFPEYINTKDKFKSVLGDLRSKVGGTCVLIFQFYSN